MNQYVGSKLVEQHLAEWTIGFWGGRAAPVRPPSLNEPVGSEVVEHPQCVLPVPRGFRDESFCAASAAIAVFGVTLVPP